MDTSIEATALVRAWELLADLAACGQDNTTIRDAQELASRIADHVARRLPCPWGLILLQSSVQSAASARWGLDDERAQRLLTRNGYPLPADLIDIPLQHEGVPAGMLLLGAAPSAEAVLTPGFLQALRGQIELLISVQRRETERLREQATLDAASALRFDLTGRIDLREVVRALLERAVVLSGAHSGGIYTVIEDGSLELMVSHGLRQDYSGTRLERGQGLSGQVVEQRKILIVDDYQHYEHRSPHFAEEPIEAGIGVPLLVQDELIGVLILMHTRPDARFSNADQSLIEAFAKPAALVVRNAQLFAQQQQRARELYVLYENGQVLNSSLQIEPMLVRVAENITVAMGADRSALHLIDQNQTGTLYEAASYSADGHGEPAGQRYTINSYEPIARLLQSGEALVLGGQRTTEPKSARAVLELFDYRSGLFLALRMKERAVGLLSIGYVEQNHRFSRAEINLAQTLASQVSTALVNARLYMAEQQRARELERLQSISQRLEADLSLDDMLKAILDGVQSLIPCAGAEICLYEASGLYVALTRGIRPDGEPPLQRINDGLTGWLARHRRALRLPDFQRPPIRPLFSLLADGSLARSYLGLPLQVGDQLVGTLELFSTKADDFSPEDERLLTIVAGQAAQAINNTRRYEQADEHLRSRVQQLTALQRISRQLTSNLSLGHILGFTLEEALRATQATNGYIALREGFAFEEAMRAFSIEDGPRSLSGDVDQDGRVRVIAAIGYDEPDRARLLTQSVSGSATVAAQAMTSGEPALADDLTAEDRIAAIGPAAAAALAVPIYYEAQVVGVVNLHSQAPHAFTHDALEFVRALADQAALAIGNTQRYNEQVRQRELLLQRAGLLKEVLDIGQALRTDPAIAEVLEQIAFSIVETVGFRVVIINLVDEDDPTVLRVVTAAGLPLEELERIRRGAWPVVIAQRFLDTRFRLGRAFYIPSDALHDLEADVDLSDISTVSITDERMPHEWQADDALFVPLYSTRGKLLGIISVDNPYDRQRPTRRSVEPLEIYAQQAAIAIENLSLLREARDQAAQMTALARASAAAVSTLDLDDLLERVYAEIAAYLGTPPFFFVLSYDQQSNLVRYELFKEQGEIRPAYQKATQAKAGLSGWIIDNGEPLYIHDLLEHPDQLPATPVPLVNTVIRSWVGIPLRSQNQVIGVLSVQSHQPHAFGDRDVEFLSTLANQLAVALEKARLFSEREQRLAELNVINAIGQVVNSTLDIERMLVQVYERLAAFLNMDSFLGLEYRSDLNQIVTALLVDEGERSFEYREHQPTPGGLVDWIVTHRQPLLFGDLRAESKPRGFQLTRFGNVARASASWLGVPLLVGDDECIGVLSIQSYTPNRYSSREQAFLSTVAGQVALGVQNVRLFADRERKIAELDAIGRIGRVTNSTLDLRPMVEGLSQVLREALDADGISLTLLSPERNRARVLVLDRDEPLVDGEHDLARIDEETLAGWIARHSRALRLDDIEQAASAQPDLRPMFLGPNADRARSYLGIPILTYDGTPIGTLGVSSRRPEAFTARDEASLISVGAQVSLGVQNARLFAQAQEQVQRISLINRVSSAAASTLEIDEIYQAAVDAMVRGSGADQVRIILYDRARDTSILVAEHIPTPNLKRIRIPVTDNPLIAWLDEHRRPLIVYDAQHDPIFVRFHAIFRDLNIGSVAQIPLLAGERVIGAIGLDVIGHQYHFSNQDIELCQTIANQMVTAIENARLFSAAQESAAALQRKVGELETLLEAARVLSSSLKPREVLDMLMEVVGRHLVVNTVALWTIADNSVLVPAAMLGIPPEVARKLRPPVGKGLTGRVAATGKPLVIADVEHEGGSLYPDFNRANQYTSFMGVPVIYRGSTVGVLSVMTVNRREFSRDEELLLAGMADQAAIALQNAQLFEERERQIAELTTLNQISRAINATLDVGELLRSLHHGIGEVLDISISFIGLYDPPTRRITFPIARIDGQDYEDDEVVQAEQPDTLAARVILERQPILLHTIEEVEALEPTPPEQGPPRIASYVGVPIMLGANVLGMLTVQSTMPHAYGENDLRFLTTVAGQAATALANARLFEERERRLRESNAMRDIGSAVTSTLDLQDVLERLHTELGRVIDVSNSFVALYEVEQNILSYPIAYDYGTRVQSDPKPLSDGVNHWVITRRQPLLLGSKQEYWSFFQAAGYDTSDGPPACAEESYLVVPIISGDDAFGVINIQSLQQHAFDDDDMRFVATVANQAAIAIHNARMFQERGRRIEELATFNEIGQALSAVTRHDELIELIHRQTSRLLDTTNFYIALYDEWRNRVSFPLFYSKGRRLNPNPMDVQDSMTAYVIRAREPLLIQGPDYDEQIEARGIVPLGARAKSWLGVPMIAADRVIGVIGIEDPERDNAYSQDDVRLLATIASWGATAIENARLLGETRQSVQELTALHEVSVALTGSLDTTDIQHIVASGAIELFKAEVCAIYMLDRERRITQQTILDTRDLGNIERRINLAARGMTRQLLESDHPLVFNNIASTVQESALASEMDLYSAMGAVLGPHDQPTGVIWLGTHEPRDWQERDVSLLSILANQCGQALESARLFQSEQSRRRIADTLRDVSSTLTSVLALDQITDLILEQLQRVVPYDTAALLLRDGDRVSITATRGFSKAVETQLRSASFSLAKDENMKLIVETRRPVVVEDAQKAPDFVPIEGTEHIHGWIGAPLLIDEEVIGLLTVDSSIVGAYSEDDAQLTFALASLAAQAIRNGRLFEEVRRFAAELEQRVIERTAALAEANAQLSAEKERLQAVHAITLELSESLDLEETLTKSLGLASKALGVDRGSIMLRDQQSKTLICRAVLTAEGDVRSTLIPIGFNRGPGLVGWVIEHQEAINVPDVRRDKRWLREEGRADEVRSVVAIPLKTKDETLGVLMLTSPKVNYFTEAQTQLMTTIANEIAIVIHNAELYSFITEQGLRLADLLDNQREETSKSQAILQSVTEGVIVLDEQERVVLFNPSAEQVLNIPAAFALHQPLSHLKNYSEQGAFTQQAELIYNGLHEGLRALDESGKPHNRMLDLPLPARSIAMNFAPVIRPDGIRHGSVAVLRDVTREIEADRAKRDFISSVSHELRTPLTSIKGYVDLLLLGAAGPLGEGQQSFLSVVKNNANRLMDLINDILEIGRIDADKIRLNFESIAMGDIFQDVLQTMHAEIERKSTTVKVDVEPDLPQIPADVRRVTQVVLNLVSNAVKYTYPGAQVVLRAFINPAELLQVDIEDNGVGISPEQQQHLFRRFYRADNPLRDEVGGTGLGLSIAKSFVELHGGEMWVRSESGKGSTFSFMLPLTQPELAETTG
jgi:GAF domain-containing protein